MHKEVEDFDPTVVVLDPIVNLSSLGSAAELRAMLLRLVDYLKGRGVTAMFTALDSRNPGDNEHAQVSSLMDSWIQVQTLESNGERNRGLYILKSRGMSHSNQIREFILTETGVQLRDVYLGLGGVLTGSARIAHEAREAEAEAERLQLYAAKKRDIDRRRQQIQAQIAALQADLEQQDAELELFALRQRSTTEAQERTRHRILASRGVGEDGK